AERSGDSRKRIEIGARAASCSQTAQKLDPRRAPHLVQLADQHGANLTRRPYMGSPAGATIEAFDGYDAQLTGARRGLSQPEFIGRGSELDADWQVPAHCLIGADFGGADLIGG